MKIYESMDTLSGSNKTIFSNDEYYMNYKVKEVINIKTTSITSMYLLNKNEIDI